MHQLRIVVDNQYNPEAQNDEGISPFEVSHETFADGVIFVNAKKAFSIKYLQYHEELLCRGHLSSTAISHAYHTVHSDSGLHIVADFKKLHASALFYFMAVREFGTAGSSYRNYH